MSLTLDFQDNVAVLTHDDGKRNAFSPDAIRDFNAALDEVEAKKAALTWVGREGCFSAGFDLKVMASGDADAAAAMVKSGGELAFRIFTFPHPVVCAVTGHCLALGSVMLVCADKRIGIEGDYKYGIQGPTHSLHPEFLTLGIPRFEDPVGEAPDPFQALKRQCQLPIRNPKNHA